MKWAFSDESKRGGTYVIAAVIVEGHGLRQARATMRRFLRGNQRRVHMSKESTARRNQFLAIVEQTVSSAVVVEASVGGHPLDTVRERAMQVLAETLFDQGVTVWSIERMVPAIEALDRQVIIDVLRRDGSHECVYDHRAAHDEPMLWAADAVAWIASRQRLAWVTTMTAP